MVVSDIDLRVLRVFRAVVEAGGFSNAQAVLNVSQSTISAQMSQLEARLGITLCQRGRSGFKLTEKGEACYRQVVELFQSIHSFQVQTDALKGGLNGRLRVGFLDNVITDPHCPLRDAFRQFVQQPQNHVRLELEVLAPAELERGLLDHSIDLAIGIFYSQLPALSYRPLYRERDSLVCGRGHRLAGLRDAGELADGIASARKVVRRFLGKQEFPATGLDASRTVASVTNVEAAAHLILTGEYIGFLPQHYAQAWIDKGELVELLPHRFARDSEFSLVTRSALQLEAGGVQAFLQCMDAAQAALQCTRAVRAAA